MRPAPPPLDGSALLVAGDASLRRHVASTLGDLGLLVHVAREPYAGMAAFLAEPTELVVVSLRGFRKRDLGFLRTLREQAPDARVLLLVPASRRQVAARALDAGGDATVVEPYDPGELTAAVRALWRRSSGSTEAAADAGASPGVAQLAAEVAHAINNPLQVLSLHLESGLGGGGTRVGTEAVAALARVRDVTSWLASYGGLGHPQRARVDVAALLEATLDEENGTGRIAPVREGLGDPAPADVDAAQVRAALRAALGLLAGASGARPAPVHARADREGRSVRLSLLAPEADRALLLHPDVDGVVLTQDTTRVAMPGLALPRAVAEAHGGSVSLGAAPPRGLRLDVRLGAR